MFIFICRWYCTAGFNVNIYIPLCLYLYRFSSGMPKDVSKIYIPLCLYLYDLAADEELASVLIYIPLCLYLYLSDGKSLCWIQNLHSTMFIFIYDLDRLLGPGCFIYIPLCLYLYQLSVWQLWNWIEFTFHYVYIYIKYKQKGEIVKKFTFHYVYIYIFKLCSQNFRLLPFTFHYVYIYMLYCVG